jgi:ubiquinone/menaquinone biosynthesis C-methylase UbiE
MSASEVHAMYERWAPSYAATPHNPLMVVEQRVMEGRLPALAGRDVLDLGCGTGRYSALASARGARCVGIDFSLAMLARARIGARIRADMTRLPVRDAVFDVVLSGLALGHATNLRRCMTEIARVLRAGGHLLYSDFHPEAAGRGLTRSFRDAEGKLLQVPADGPSVDEHRAALAAAGFVDFDVTQIRAGIEFTESFPGAFDFYRAWHGTPLVFVIRARRPEAS